VEVGTGHLEFAEVLPPHWVSKAERLRTDNPRYEEFLLARNLEGERRKRTEFELPHSKTLMAQPLILNNSNGHCDEPIIRQPHLPSIN
jgi:hypothetical protein